MATLTLKTWQTPNWGDAINAELVRLIAGPGHDIVAVPFNIRLNVENYVIVGSTLKAADDRSIVWGSGFLNNLEVCAGKTPRIKAVRGPKTRNRLLEIGVECPEIFGDPVLLFPRYYQPKLKKKYALGIVPHWRDDFHPLVKKLTTSGSMVKIKHAVGNYRFIDLINQCEIIASSSLHGLIVAEAYGIPNIFIRFFEQDLFKFHDYFESINRKIVEPIDCSNGIPFDRIIDKCSYGKYNHETSIDLDRLYDACPFKPEE